MKKLLCISALLFAMGGMVIEAQAQSANDRERADRLRMEQMRYEKACKSGSVADFKEYIRLYPNGKYAKEVQSKIADFGLWETAQQKNSISGYNEYLQKSKQKTFEAEAKSRISDLQEVKKRETARRNSEWEDRRRVENGRYEKARNSGALSDLKNYLRLYPNGRYVKEVNEQLVDYELWAQAELENTINSYNHYLNRSQHQYYANKANDKIKVLKAEEDWAYVRNSKSLDEINTYLRKYPNTKHRNEANKRVHELTAVKYYNQNRLQAAYNEFQYAGGEWQISSEYRGMYKMCKEENDYNKLSTLSSEEELLRFMNTYPDGNHKNDVSNMVAKKKAQQLTKYSDEYTFKTAFSYAKDFETLQYVQSHVDKVKSAYKEYQKEQKRNRRRRNGGLIQFGLEPLDLAYNLCADDEYEDVSAVLTYNVGLSMKIGNYLSPVQFELGVKPGLLFTTENDDSYHYGYDSYYEEEAETVFHLPIFAKLKVNFCSIGNSKLYGQVTGFYNAVRDDYYESDWSIGFGAGMAWRHWDWSIYGKTDVGEVAYTDNFYLGTSLVYYF